MKKVFKLENLDCAHCANKIEKGVQKLAGVEKASLSFMTLRLSVEASEERLATIRDDILAVIAKVEPDCRLVG